VCPLSLRLLVPGKLPHHLALVGGLLIQEPGLLPLAGALGLWQWPLAADWNAAAASVAVSKSGVATPLQHPLKGSGQSHHTTTASMQELPLCNLGCTLAAIVCLDACQAAAPCTAAASDFRLSCLQFCRGG
jgi:hypothetical protein